MMMATFAWALPGVPNGTVTDGNLVWLKNADCFGKQNWSNAMSSAASLKSGSCGLTDGSKSGDWRLPTKEELRNRKRNLSGFDNVQSSYWSSTNGEPMIANPGTSFSPPTTAFVLWIQVNYRDPSNYDLKGNHHYV